MNYSLQQIQNSHQSSGEKPIPLAKADACRREIEIFKNTKWMGSEPAPELTAEMVRRMQGDPRRAEVVFKEVMSLATTFGTFGGDAGPARALPPNNPTPVEPGPSSVDWFPAELVSELEVFPDLIGLRIADQVAPRGGSAADQANRTRGPYADRDAAAGPILAIDGAPQQTAGSVANLDCRQVAASLGVQEVSAVVKAIRAAISFKRKA